MDISIPKATLSKALTLAEGVAAKKTTMPILVNVLLSATGNSLKVSSSDLEITVVTSVPAEVRAKGSTTVNAKILSDLIRELPDGEVNLKVVEGERLEIICKNTKLRVIGVSAEEYPSLSGMSIEATGKIKASEFLEMINKTIYAVSTDETRFNLNGICFECTTEGKGKKGVSSLRMVATDGHRLAMITRPVESLTFAESVIVPRKGLSEIRRVLDELGDKEIGITIQEGFLVVDTDSTKISMRLIDGEFPDYKQVLPKGKGVVASLSSSDLVQTLRLMSLMVTDKAKCIRLDFTPGKLKLFSSSPELGDAKEELALKYDDKPLSIGFNAKYMLDFAQSIGENQEINIELNGELGPGKFLLGGDDSYFGVIMPMRLS